MKNISYRSTNCSDRSTIDIYDINNVDMSADNVLGCLYDVAHIIGYKVVSQNIDEPSGMDSYWQHIEGVLTEDVDKKSFIEHYSNLDIEYVNTLGILDNCEFSIGILTPEHRLYITYYSNMSKYKNTIQNKIDDIISHYA